jgi:CRISPR-associated protein Cmr6
MKALRESHNAFVSSSLESSSNLALRLSKINSNIDDEGQHSEKDKMLAVMTGYQMSADQQTSYQYAFNRWQQAMHQQVDSVNFEIKSSTKALLGIGNASVHEFGVSLSYPMGVPVISGTSIKGLLSSYLARHGGVGWQRSQRDSQKSEWQVELFGGDLKRLDQVKSYIGSVIFNDAWLLPNRRKWFTPDIINVHHQSYYSAKQMPDGMDNPIPIKIAALSPDLTFFVSIQGADDAIQFLLPVLELALKEEGLGAKTATGYGRFEMLKPAQEILNDFTKTKQALLSQATEQKEKEQNQAQYEALSENGKVLHRLQELLKSYDSDINTSPITEEINTVIKAAEREIEQWATEERGFLAGFMEKYYAKIGWHDTGIAKKKKDKQETKKRDRIEQIRQL